MYEESIKVLIPIMFPLPNANHEYHSVLSKRSKIFASCAKYALIEFINNINMDDEPIKIIISKSHYHIVDSDRIKPFLKRHDAIRRFSKEEFIHINICNYFILMSISFIISHFDKKIFDSDGIVVNNAREDTIQLIAEIISLKIFALVDQILIVSNLASPNSLTFGHSVAWSESGMTRTHQCLSNPFRSHDKTLPEAIAYSSLSFRSTWKWANSRSGLLTGHPVTRVDRAASCFSHLFHRDHSGVGEQRLVWAVTGLEAIFADATAGIAGQIVAKWISFNRSCVPFSNLKKLFSKAYDTRSRLLHGNLNVPGCITAKHYDEGSGSIDSISDAAYLSTVLLTCTLQMCVKKNVADIDFKYIPVVQQSITRPPGVR